MPNTLDLKRRLKSVGNIRQITRAMQLVATSKMRKAEERARNADAYAYGALEILENITKITKSSLNHLYWRRNDSRKICLILVSGNRGFCGGLNLNLFAKTLDSIKMRKEKGFEVEVITVGKKGRNFARKLNLKIIADFSELGDYFTVREITPIARIATQEFRNGNYESVVIAFNQFVNILTQKPMIREILPISVEAFEVVAEIDPKTKKFFIPNGDKEVQSQYIFEPSVETAIETLVPHLLEIEILKSILESHASEHSARMVAMKNASDKAGELIDDLHLTYNQARQAGITKEIAEISSGAMATGN